MKKSIFFITFFIVLITVLISSCKTSGVIIADSDSDRNTVFCDTTEVLSGGGKDTIRAMKIAGINSNPETDCIIIKINGPAEKINLLRKAANGNFEIHYYLKGHTPKSK